MIKRVVVRLAVDHQKPPYVPWSFGFTQEARQALQAHFGSSDLEPYLHNHILSLGNGIGFFDDLGSDQYQDVFGVIWDRSIDKDIGNVKKYVLEQPTLRGYQFPDPLDKRFYTDIPGKISLYGDRYRVFQIGFSLYERAWTMRGMQHLMMDFYDHPGFVEELFNTIVDYNLEQVRKACQYDIDAIYFGDDWGQQHGLQMGAKLWRRFIFPSLKRMYAETHRLGRAVFIHSCGDVDELFDDLLEIGLNCFNPFQPEVMDVGQLLSQYHGRLAFHGGLSTQRLLPYGTPEQVRVETLRMINLGREGGYIFSPAHDVEGDVPIENMLAFIEAVQSQPAFNAAETIA